MKAPTGLRIALTTVAILVLAAAPATAHHDLTPADRQLGETANAWQEPQAATRAQLREQVDATGLAPSQARSLQDRVARVVDRTGGTQVAINQVAWNGGDTLIPLPGEKRARELGVAPKATTAYGCQYYQFCTYGKRDFTGIVDRISSCTWHISHGFFVAYVNNQTPGTRARFYNYYRQFIAISQPAFYKDAQFGNDLGHNTHYIRPC